MSTAPDDPEVVHRDLLVELTPEDLQRMADHMSQTEINVEGLKDKRKDLNKEIGELQKHLNKLAHCVDSGNE